LASRKKESGQPQTSLFRAREPSAHREMGKPAAASPSWTSGRDGCIGLEHLQDGLAIGFGEAAGDTFGEERAHRLERVEMFQERQLEKRPMSGGTAWVIRNWSCRGNDADEIRIVSARSGEW